MFLHSTHKGYVHEFYEDTYAETPADRATMKRNEIVEDITNIRSLSSVYDFMREEHDFDIQEYRVMIEEEKIPSPEEIDQLVGIFKSVDATTGIVFNCVSDKLMKLIGIWICCICHSFVCYLFVHLLLLCSRWVKVQPPLVQ